MPDAIIKAVRWRGSASRGATSPQRFELSDRRIAFVKFSQNSQGERVLANEFICSRLADLLDVPIARAMLVEVPHSVLAEARLESHARIPANFLAGVHVGTLELEAANSVPVTWQEAVAQGTSNAHQWEALEVFNVWVYRDDKPEILTYNDAGRARFVAIDYGFAFNGKPDWDDDIFAGMGDADLPWSADRDRCAGQAAVIHRLRTLDPDQILAAIQTLGLPRFGVTDALASSLADVLHSRAQHLVSDYDNLCGGQT